MEIFVPFYSDSVRVQYSKAGLTAIQFVRGVRDYQAPADAMGQTLVDELKAYLKGQTSNLKKFIDWKGLAGTDFQKRVWKKMTTIKAGATMTYGEIAQSLNTPGAARAVGSACAKNPVLLAIPCHRVVGKQNMGQFSGGGPEIKKKLLQHEGVRFVDYLKTSQSKVSHSS